MRLDRFFLYTGIGAAIWCSVLLAIGWAIGKAGETLSRAEVSLYTRHAMLAMVPVTVILVGGYVWWHRRRSRRPGSSSVKGDG
jgi:membrane protein DedA with SNARE-associated domain